MDNNLDQLYSSAGKTLRRYVIYQLACGDLVIGCLPGPSPCDWHAIVSSHCTRAEAEAELAKPWMKGLWHYLRHNPEKRRFENLFSINRSDN